MWWAGRLCRSWCPAPCMQHSASGCSRRCTGDVEGSPRASSRLVGRPARTQQTCSGGRPPRLRCMRPTQRAHGGGGARRGGGGAPASGRWRGGWPGPRGRRCKERGRGWRGWGRRGSTGEAAGAARAAERATAGGGAGAGRVAAAGRGWPRQRQDERDDCPRRLPHDPGVASPARRRALSCGLCIWA